MRKYTTYAVLLLTLLSFAMAGCGDSSESTTTTTTTPTATPMPTTPSEAEISVAVVEPFVGVASDGTTLFIFGLFMSESGGLGANINFVRLDIFRATGEFEERSEIGSGLIIQGVGANRLEANTNETASVTLPFRATIKTGREMLLTVGFTDDAGNTFESTSRFVFS